MFCLEVEGKSWSPLFPGFVLSVQTKCVTSMIIETAVDETLATPIWNALIIIIIIITMLLFYNTKKDNIPQGVFHVTTYTKNKTNSKSTVQLK